MRWAWLAAIGFLAFGPLPGAHSQSKDLELLGKTRGEWIDILKSHKEAKFRRASILVLEAFGPRTVGITGALIEALEKEPDPELRREVALALGRMGPDAKEAAGPLADVAKKDKEGVVRAAALTALGGKMLDTVPDSAGSVFVHGLKDPFPASRAAAIDGLKNLGDKAEFALPQAMEFAGNPKEERVPRAVALGIVGRVGTDEPKATQLLIAILQKADEPSQLRVAAAEGLGRMTANPKDAVEVLAAVVKNKDAALRLTAAASLVRLGAVSKPAWPAVVATWKEADSAARHQYIRFAGMFGEESKEAVAKLAEAAEMDVTTENRLAACQELEQLGSKAADAIPALMRVAQDDPRISVREAAAEALKKIQAK
ncbi:MAG: HEAT repeat domain-containing protein [Gemmataceae bacterium]|nr:HEAT repeat domain-containing protein [Gemmataceae bacterium]